MMTRFINNNVESTSKPVEKKFDKQQKQQIARSLRSRKEIAPLAAPRERIQAFGQDNFLSRRTTLPSARDYHPTNQGMDMMPMRFPGSQRPDGFSHNSV